MASRKSYSNNWRLDTRSVRAGRYAPYKCGRNWHKFDMLFPGDFPALPCCYVLYSNDKIIYIGSTINLYKRFYGDHRITHTSHFDKKTKSIYYRFQTKWGEFENLYVKVRFSDFLGDWAQKEIYFIHRLKPMFNKMYTWG
jgi:hypothetical protein